MRVAGVLVGVGAAAMLAKGVLLVATGNDRSLVPWFALFASLGLAIAALSLWLSARRLRWLAAGGGASALLAVAASLVAVGYLITGTIPETDNAPAAVGVSYVVLAVGDFVALLMLGVVIAANRSQHLDGDGSHSAYLAAQFPIFIVAGAIGDTIGSETVTDGLGLALTGAAWIRTHTECALTRSGIIRMPVVLVVKCRVGAKESSRDAHVCLPVVLQEAAVSKPQPARSSAIRHPDSTHSAGVIV